MWPLPHWRTEFGEHAPQRPGTRVQFHSEDEGSQGPLALGHAILEEEGEQYYHFLRAQCSLLRSTCLVLAPLSCHPARSSRITSAHP